MGQVRDNNGIKHSITIQEVAVIMKRVSRQIKASVTQMCIIINIRDANHLKNNMSFKGIRTLWIRHWGMIPKKEQGKMKMLIKWMRLRADHASLKNHTEATIMIIIEKASRWANQLNKRKIIHHKKEILINNWNNNILAKNKEVR